MAHEQKDLDRIIDEALAQYSAVESPPGLEARVLGRISFVKQVQRAWWPWVAGFAAAAAAIILIARGGHLQPPRTAPPVAPMEARVEANLRLSPALPPGVRPRKARVRPKSARFPAPAPLSDTERTLLSFAAQHPEDARDAGQWLQKGPPEEIVISPIEIPPLKDDGEQ